jgi:hypothetical protein
MDTDKSDEPPRTPSRQVRGLGKQWFFYHLKIQNPKSSPLNPGSSSFPLAI